MRIGVISDTHIPDRAKELPRQVIIGLKGVDLIVHAGDIVSLSFLDELKKLAPQLKAVCGNMDYPELTSILPQEEIFMAGKYRIAVTHGRGNPANLLATLKERFRKEGVDVVIFGHSHKSFNEMIDGILYFNPGSPTDKIFCERNSYGIIEINDNINARIITI